MQVGVRAPSCAVAGRGRSRAAAAASLSPWLRAFAAHLWSQATKFIFKQPDWRKRWPFYLSFGDSVLDRADGRIAKSGDGRMAKQGGEGWPRVRPGNAWRGGSRANPRRCRLGLDRGTGPGQQRAVASGDTGEKGGVEKRGRGIVAAAVLRTGTRVARDGRRVSSAFGFWTRGWTR